MAEPAGGVDPDPRQALATLSERARRLLRTNPVVESLAAAMAVEEVYQAYAY